MPELISRHVDVVPSLVMVATISPCVMVTMLCQRWILFCERSEQLKRRRYESIFVAKFLIKANRENVCVSGVLGVGTYHMAMSHLSSTTKNGQKYKDIKNVKNENHQKLIIFEGFSQNGLHH